MTVQINPQPGEGMLGQALMAMAQSRASRDQTESNERLGMRELKVRQQEARGMQGLERERMGLQSQMQQRGMDHDQKLKQMDIDLQQRLTDRQMQLQKDMLASQQAHEQNMGGTWEDRIAASDKRWGDQMKLVEDQRKLERGKLAGAMSLALQQIKAQGKSREAMIKMVEARNQAEAWNKVMTGDQGRIREMFRDAARYIDENDSNLSDQTNTYNGEEVLRRLGWNPSMSGDQAAKFYHSAMAAMEGWSPAAESERRMQALLRNELSRMKTRGLPDLKDADWMGQLGLLIQNMDTDYNSVATALRQALIGTGIELPIPT